MPRDVFASLFPSAGLSPMRALIRPVRDQGLPRPQRRAERAPLPCERDEESEARFRARGRSRVLPGPRWRILGFTRPRKETSMNLRKTFRPRLEPLESKMVMSVGASSVPVAAAAGHPGPVAAAHALAQVHRLVPG